MSVCVPINGLLAATWSNYIVDIVIILFIVGLTIICAKRGFIECLFDFASTFISFFAAILVAKFLLTITGGLFGLESWVGSSFGKAFMKIDGFDLVISADGAKTALAEKNVAGVIVNLGVRWFAKGKVADGTTIAQLVGNITGKLCVLLIFSIVLFFAAKLALLLAKTVLNGIIERIKILDATNTAVGAIVGLAQAVFIVGAVLAVFMVIPIPAIDNFLSDCVFMGWLYEYNPVIAILGLLI